MSALANLEANIAKLEAAAEAAAAATRDLHAATKDARDAKRELAALVESINTEAAKAVASAVEAAATQGIKDLGESFGRASNDIYKRVINQVDLIVNMAVGMPGRTKAASTDLRPALAKGISETIDKVMREKGL